MHNTNNNNTVYEDITLWSTERSCGVQARGVTTPKSIYTSVPMHTTTKTRMWAAAVHPCVCGCRAYVATYLLESVARKNSVKTHKFMNLCDFTKFSLHIFRRIMLTMRKSGKKQMVSEETSGYRPWGTSQKSNAK